MFGQLKWLTYLLVGIIIFITVSIIVIRRRQRQRMREARVRGYKQALQEQQQFSALRQLEGRQTKDVDYSLEDRYLGNRREIRRNRRKEE